MEGASRSIFPLLAAGAHVGKARAAGSGGSRKRAPGAAECRVECRGGVVGAGSSATGNPIMHPNPCWLPQLGILCFVSLHPVRQIVSSSP